VVVEEALYTMIVSLIVALLIIVTMFLLPIDEFERVVKSIYNDIEYMIYFVRGL